MVLLAGLVVLCNYATVFCKSKYISTGLTFFRILKAIEFTFLNLQGFFAAKTHNTTKLPPPPMTTTSGTNSAHAVTKRLQADLVDLMVM